MLTSSPSGDAAPPPAAHLPHSPTQPSQRALGPTVMPNLFQCTAEEEENFHLLFVLLNFEQQKYNVLYNMITKIQTIKSLKKHSHHRVHPCPPPHYGPIEPMRPNKYLFSPIPSHFSSFLLTPPHSHSFSPTHPP